MIELEHQEGGAPLLDITGDACPMTFVKVRLALESISPGEVLRVRLNGGEPLENIPKALAQEGQEVTVPEADGGVYLLRVTKRV